MAFACTPKVPALPAGAATPFPEYQQAWQDATRDCAGVHTLTASLALSGKVGRTKMHGRIDAGFAEPASARLEGVAPFGRPVFVLVAVGERATLVLPRDDRVLREARPEDIVDALAGIRLGPADLRAVVAGCGLNAAASAHDGRHFPDGWVAIDLDRSTAFLRRVDSGWRIAAASAPHMTVHYERDRDGRPSVIRLVTDPSTTASDLTLRVSEAEINVTLDPRAFTVQTPPRAEPITLAELRRAGPLGEGRKQR
jgi:hypothetical protein